jgi:hypothetical protein
MLVVRLLRTRLPSLRNRPTIDMTLPAIAGG